MIICSSEDIENTEWPWNLDIDVSAFVWSWQQDGYRLSLLWQAIEYCAFSSMQSSSLVFARILPETKLIPLTKKQREMLEFKRIYKFRRKCLLPDPGCLKTIAHFHLTTVCPLRKDIHKFLYCLPTMPFALLLCYSWRRREAPRFMWRMSASSLHEL